MSISQFFEAARQRQERRRAEVHASEKPLTIAEKMHREFERRVVANQFGNMHDVAAGR